MDSDDIYDFIDKNGNKYFKENFVGVFPIDKLTTIIKGIEKKITLSLYLIQIQKIILVFTGVEHIY